MQPRLASTRARPSGAERAVRDEPGAICIAAFEKRPVLGQELTAFIETGCAGMVSRLDDIPDRTVEVLSPPPDIDLLEPLPCFRLRHKAGTIEHRCDQIAKRIPLLSRRLGIRAIHRPLFGWRGCRGEPPGTDRSPRQGRSARTPAWPARYTGGCLSCSCYVLKRILCLRQPEPHWCPGRPKVEWRLKNFGSLVGAGFKPALSRQALRALTVIHSGLDAEL